MQRIVVPDTFDNTQKLFLQDFMDETIGQIITLEDSSTGTELGVNEAGINESTSVLYVNINGTVYGFSNGGAGGTTTGVINVIIDGGGSAITTGVKLDVYIPFACTLTAITMLADQSGSIVVDIWKDSYSSYPPTVADTITASAKPTITTATKSQDTTLTGWTKSIAAGSTLRFNCDSITTLTRVMLGLNYSRSI